MTPSMVPGPRKRGSCCGGIVVGEQLEIERLDQVEALVGGDRVVGGHQHVPAGGARLQLRQHLLVGAEDVDVDGDAGLLGEVVVVLLREVVGPGGDVERARQAGIGLARAQARHGGAEHRRGEAQARDAEEVAAADAALLVAAEFLEEFLGRDMVRMSWSCVFSLCFVMSFKYSAGYALPRRAIPRRSCRRCRRRPRRAPTCAGPSP